MNTLFRPFRVLGIVSSDVSGIVQQRGAKSFLTVPIDNYFHVYDVLALRLRLVGPMHGHRINSLIGHGDYTITAGAQLVHLYRRGKLIGDFEGHLATVNHLLTIGDHLISIDKDNEVLVWLVPSMEIVSRFRLPNKAQVTSLCHPDTYLNKILVGYSNGELELWNISSQSKIYTFTNHLSEVKKDSNAPAYSGAVAESSIMCIEQSPALDIVGIGLASGDLLLHDLKRDTTLMSFRIANQQARVLSFRTDGPPMMAAGDEDGNVLVWDLEKQELVSTIRKAHGASVVMLEFPAKEGLLLTVGADNCIKLYIFDQTDDVPRLLKSRSGHSGVCRRLRFYGGDTQVAEHKNMIISAGGDRSFRLTNTIRDEQSVEMSQGSGLVKQARDWGVAVDSLKLTPVVDFDFCEMRENDWGNIVTVHEGSAEAVVWSFEKKARTTLSLAAPDRKVFTAVCVSPCGNFVILTSSGNNLYKFNVQSGILRRTAQLKHSRPQHVFSDSINKSVMVVSCEGHVEVFEFNRLSSEGCFEIGAGVTCAAFYRTGDLMAVGCDDFGVRVFDVQARRLVRHYAAVHSRQLTDIAFAPDGRMLATCAGDGSLVTYDLVGGKALETQQLPGPAASLSFAPSGEMLAVALVGVSGIHLYSNSQYFSAPIGLTDGSSVQSDDADAAKAGADVRDGLATLSSLPEIWWQNLSVLETIKERNKPTQPAKKPENLPFFLGSASKGLSGVAAFDTDAAAADTHISSSAGLNSLSRLETLLLASERNPAAEKDVMSFLMTLGPSGVSSEIAQLSAEPLGTPSKRSSLGLFLNVLTAECASLSNFEAVEAVVGEVLKTHGSALVDSADLRVPLESLLRVHKAVWDRMGERIQASMCLTRHFGKLV